MNASSNWHLWQAWYGYAGRGSYSGHGLRQCRLSIPTNEWRSTHGGRIIGGVERGASGCNPVAVLGGAGPSCTELGDALGVVLPEGAPGGTYIYNQFVIRSGRRDDLERYLKERQIGTKVDSPIPCTRRNASPISATWRGGSPSLSARRSRPSLYGSTRS